MPISDVSVFLPLFPCLLALAACAAEPAPPTDPDIAPAMTSRAAMTDLDRFRQPAQQPSLLAALPLAAGRSYAILIHLPGPAPVDLSDPAIAQVALRSFLNPVSTSSAGTALGHAIVGWRCGDDPRPVLVAKSGEQDFAGLRMVMSGWGLAAFLSDFHDGYLQVAAAPGTRNGRALTRGRGRVTAFEIGQDDCDRMRRALITYIHDPAAPSELYSMLPQPDRPLGEGCGGFAMWLAGQGGVMDGVTPLLIREVPLSDRYIGAGRAPGGPVTPFRPVGQAAPGPVPPLRLIFGSWEGGRDLGRVTLLDMELLLVALERALALAGPDYTPDPRLPRDAPAVVAVQAEADRWLARYRRVTPLRMGRAQAVVLHLH